MAPRVPSLISGIDVFALPLSTKEGFVLSRVDGASSVEDISIMVGIRADELIGILEKLQDLGAVHLSWAPRRAALPKAPQAPIFAAGNAPRADSSVARALAEPDEPLFDSSELDEDVEIPRDARRRILNMFYGLEEKNYYDLLGVSRDADKKAIRSAYFELSRLFHPDAYFGKRLGSYKTKMEVVFKRFTEAYDALGRAPKRREYDEYLATTQKTTVMRETLEQVERETAGLLGSIPPVRPDSEPPARQPLRAVLPPADPGFRLPSHSSLRPPATPDERRVAARERLRRGLGADKKSSEPPPRAAPLPAPSPAAPSTVPPAPGEAKERRDSVITGLRRSLRAARTITGGTDPVIEQIKRAKDMETAGDLLGAAGALQAALALDPERKEIQEQYERVSRSVARALADNYEKQARYEEKMGKWDAAAMSWARVADGRPEDVRAAASAVEALLKARGDMHRAQRYAQRVVDQEPNKASHRALLARVFLAAGLRLNARRELEKAVKLDPMDEMIKNLFDETR